MSSVAEQRVSNDRRIRPTPMWSARLFRGRRRAGRREHECINIYVDRYRLAEFAPIFALFLLSMIDWLWTLRHLSRAIEEANPVMAWTLAVGGTAGFAIAKLGLSGLTCGFLLLHARFRLTRVLLPVALAAYAYAMVVHVLTETV